MGIYPGYYSMYMLWDGDITAAGNRQCYMYTYNHTTLWKTVSSLSYTCTWHYWTIPALSPGLFSLASIYEYTYLCSPNSFTSWDMILSSHAPPSSCKITGVVKSNSRWPEGVRSSTYIYRECGYYNYIYVPSKHSQLHWCLVFDSTMIRYLAAEC